MSGSFSSLVLPQSNFKRTASFNASAVAMPLVSVTSPITGPTVPLKSGSLRGPSSTPLQPKMSSFSNLNVSRPGIPSQFTSGAYFVTAPVARTISEDDAPAPSVEAEPESDFDQLFDAVFKYELFHHIVISDKIYTLIIFALKVLKSKNWICGEIHVR